VYTEILSILIVSPFASIAIQEKSDHNSQMRLGVVFPRGYRGSYKMKLCWHCVM